MPLTGEYEHRNRANGEEGEEVKTTMMIFEQRQSYLALFICMILFHIQDDGKQQSICVNATSDEGGGGIVFINYWGSPQKNRGLFVIFPKRRAPPPPSPPFWERLVKNEIFWVIF